MSVIHIECAGTLLPHLFNQTGIRCLNSLCFRDFLLAGGGNVGGNEKNRADDCSDGSQAAQDNSNCAYQGFFVESLPCFLYGVRLRLSDFRR